MGKRVHLGVNNVPRNVTKIYVGVNGVARKVIKGYVGVNGVARVFWDGGGGSIIGFWFYYSTIIEKFMRIETITGVPTPLNNDIYKRSNGLVFYCLAKGSSGYNHLFTFTTDRNAMNMDIVREDGVTTHIGLSAYMRLNDDTWFYDHRTFNENVDMQYPADFEPNCVIVNSAFDSMSYTDILTWILNNMIYLDDFAEDYQVGQTYNLVKADMEKTIRKFLAVYLFKMIPYKSSYTTSYNSILTNIENIVNFFLQHRGANSIINLWADYNENSDGFRLGANYSNDSVNNVQIESIEPQDGFSMVETNGYISYLSSVYIDFNGDGTVSYQTPSWSYEDTLYIGKGGYGWDYLNWSNVGLKFAHTRGWVLPDFTPSQTYTLNATWDIENFIYNTIQKYIEKNASYTQSPEIFTQLKENMSAIVSYLASFKGNRSGVAIKFSSGIAYQKMWTLYIVVQYLDTPKTLAIIDKQTKNGATYYTTNPFVVGAYTGEPAYEVSISMNSQVQISYQTITTGTNVNNIGYRWEYFSSYGYYELNTTNLGMVEE